MRVPLLGFVGLLCGGLVSAHAAATERHSIVSEVTHRREHVGQCFSTHIQRVRTRDPDGNSIDGEVVVFADGHMNISYDDVAAVRLSKPGDPVRLCVRNLPAGPPECPPHDNRGIVYRGENLRTHMKWELPDFEHGCGGA